MVGRRAVADPAIIGKFAAQGHTIASHTWTHKNLKRWSKGRAKGETELGISTIKHALGKPIAPFFRFPYLSDPNHMIDYLKGRDLAIFSFDVDPYNYRTCNGDRLCRTIMRQLANRIKGILLFDDIQISTVRAMLGLLNNLKRKGFKVVHIAGGSPSPTLAAFDGQAAELHAKRSYSPSIRPIGSSDGEKRSRPAKKSSRKTEAPKKPKPKVAAAPPKPPTPKVNSDWKKQIFGN